MAAFGCLRVLCAHLVVAGQTLLIEDGLLDQLVEVVREYPAIDFGYYLGRGTLESGWHLHRRRGLPLVFVTPHTAHLFAGVSIGDRSHGLDRHAFFIQQLEIQRRW